MPDLSAAANDAASRRHRWRLRRGGAVVLVLPAIVDTVLACEFAGWPFLRAPLHVGSLHLGSPTGNGVSHLVQAVALSLRWQWRAVLARRDAQPWPQERLQACNLDARLVRMADGRTNWRAQNAVPAAVDDGETAPGLPVQPRLLALQDGRLHLHDASWRLELDCHFTWLEGGADTPSRFRVSADGQWRDTPLALKAEALGQLLLVAADSAGRRLVPLDVQGRLGTTVARFRGVAAELWGPRALSGSLLVRGPSLAALGQALGLTRPTTPPFRLAGALRHEAGRWGLVATEGHIGGSRLAADLQSDSRGVRPRLTGNVAGPLLRLKDLGPAVGTPVPDDIPARPPVFDADGQAPAGTARAAAAAAGPRRAGRVLPDRSFDLPSLLAMDADVRLAVGRLDLGNDAAVAPLRSGARGCCCSRAC